MKGYLPSNIRNQRNRRVLPCTRCRSTVLPRQWRNDIAYPVPAQQHISTAAWWILQHRFPDHFPTLYRIQHQRIFRHKTVPHFTMMPTDAVSRLRQFASTDLE